MSDRLILKRRWQHRLFLFCDDLVRERGLERESCEKRKKDLMSWVFESAGVRDGRLLQKGTVFFFGLPGVAAR